MKKSGKVYHENDEDISREKREKNANDGYPGETPLAAARKVAAVCCGGFWLFSAAGMLFGVDFRAMSPFLFFSLAAVAFLNLPAFWVKRKYADFVICVIAGTVCAAVGLSLMTAGKAEAPPSGV
ncbi:MAG: hypothetical protein LBI38_04575 [Oscillospiraceae bacterium]|nr:hypothetical protein [Oscillospiraceae bacterium]